MIRSHVLLEHMIQRCQTVYAPCEEPSEADTVAALCIAEYQARCGAHAAGCQGQTVVAGFVLSCPSPPGYPPSYTVLSLGVGTKFMPPSVAQRDTTRELVHDSHAEVLARRGLQRFLHGQLALGIESEGREGLFRKFRA